MPEQTITREQLATAVDTALANIPDDSLTIEPKKRLREVAATTDVFATGSFCVDGVGCPAHQAGLSERGGHELADAFAFAGHRLAFALTFDLALKDMGYGSGIIHVQELTRWQRFKQRFK